MNEERDRMISPARMSLMDRLIHACLTNKFVVFVIAAGIILAGLIFAPFDWKLGGLPRKPVPVDAIPDIGENQQIVFTEWPGRSPQDVEDQITYPLTVSLLGTPGVKTIRSYSYFGFSSIFIIFREDQDFYDSRSRILEKLNSLPRELRELGIQPSLGPDATGLGQIFWYTLEGRDPDGKPIGGWDLDELRSIQDWNVRYSLMSSTDDDGNKPIADVASVGGYVKEYQIDVDPDAMRANGVTLDNVSSAVQMSNVDVGARTIEMNRVEYVIRGLGLITGVADLESVVLKENDNVPITIKDIGNVTIGPALRRGALDKGGSEAVGGVVIVRHGANPLTAIQAVKKQIEIISPSLPTAVVIDYGKVSKDEVVEFALDKDFSAFNGARLNDDAWLEWLKATPSDEWPAWVNTSKVTIVPFYDRTGLIHETLGTLNTALEEEILVTIIVVIVLVLHMRSSILISGLLPMAVLMCFIAMKTFGVDANIVALSGIAIAIGTMVDMGIIICENILRHLDMAPPGESRLQVVFQASREVGGAVLTAVSTTIVSFLPVFFMTGREGKLFKPLAFTKTFALIASVLIALTLIPPAAHLLFAKRVRKKQTKWLLSAAVIILGIAALIWLRWWIGLIVIGVALYHIAFDAIPERLRKFGPYLLNGLAVLLIGYILTRIWMPLGPARGIVRNLVFVTLLIGGLLVFFSLFRRAYRHMLRWFLAHKIVFLAIPTLLVVFGLYIWIGPGVLFGPMNEAPSALFSRTDADAFVGEGLLDRQNALLTWTNKALSMTESDFRKTLDKLGTADTEGIVEEWNDTKAFVEMSRKDWENPKDPEDTDPKYVKNMTPAAKLRWTLARDWNGLGKEFMPPLDEGSFLWMPTTGAHASIGEALDTLRKQDMAIAAIPEVKSVVGKIGRAETPIDPAPISMVETVIDYKSEYMTDEQGRRVNFRYDREKNEFLRDVNGNLIPDSNGRPFRQWRDQIKSPDDIWDEIAKAGEIPGSTSAPELQPIMTRIIMLQSGMRSPMGIKVTGPDLQTIDRFLLHLEQQVKKIPSIDPRTVNADRIVGKPYIEIRINRDEIKRYGLHVKNIQDVIGVAIGGNRISTTIEGRERYPIRVRYMRELRDQIEELDNILVAAPGGAQIPMKQLADIEYVRGPMSIKSEDTALVGYLIFNKKPGYAEVDVVEEASRFLKAREASGELIRPDGVNYRFAGTYEDQIRSQKTLSIVLPIALVIIFLILYLQFESVPTTLIVFSGIVVAWAGGFMLIWLYGQPWFLDIRIFGVDLRDLFQIGRINLSVAIWVGFLALFGIASDDGVVIATFLDQSFARGNITSIRDIREATIEGAARRIRPCLMTSATTILALIPVLTSTGRGSDVMVPMAIPSFGGMLVVLVSVFVVPVLYSMVRETRFRRAAQKEKSADPEGSGQIDSSTPTGQ